MNDPKFVRYIINIVMEGFSSVNNYKLSTKVEKTYK